MIIKDFKCPYCNYDLSSYDIPVMSVSDIITEMAVCPACSKEIKIPKPSTAQGTALGDFLLETKLGSGGMGEVWLAKQVSMDRKVAVKILSPSLSQDSSYVIRFMQEVKLSAKLDHPNIVTAFSAGEEKGLRYMAVAFIDGEDVNSMIEKRGSIAEAEALKIVREIASALDYAWENHRILHRDIKPANIMIDRKGNAKLMDMGISKSTESESSMTMTGMMVGTPHYVSIEQAMGKKDLDFRSDEYSLGATLYHMVAGSVPFDAPTAMAVLMRHINDPIPSPRDSNPEVSDKCAALIEIMMAKSPDDRHKSWKDLISDIDLVLAKKYPATVKRPSPGKTMVNKALLPGGVSSMPRRNEMEAETRPFWKKPLVLASAAAVAIIAAIAIFAVLKSGGRGSPDPQKNVPPVASVPAVPSTTAPVDDATAENMIKTAIEELKKKNPQQKEWKVEYTKETDGWFLDLKENHEMSDISPLKGLPLAHLELYKANVSDISPLKGMSLTNLGLYHNDVSGIGILKGMPLQELNLGDTKVSDISVLEGMLLRKLYLYNTKVSDFSFLRGMPLEYLSLTKTKVSYLSMLEGMPLKELGLGHTQISDISVLKGMPLISIDLMDCKNIKELSPLAECRNLSSLILSDGTSLKDIAALKGLPIKNLHLNNSPITDISSLRGMPLEELNLFGCKDLNDVSPLAECKQLIKLSIPEHCKNIDSLRNLPNLKILDNKKVTWESKQPPAEFWKAWDAKHGEGTAVAPAKPSTEENRDASKDTDAIMSLLRKNLKEANTDFDKEISYQFDTTMNTIVGLNLRGCKIYDLSPLSGLQLKALNLEGCSKITDITPLKGMPLEFLMLTGCSQITDISPLKGMPLKELSLHSTNVTNLEPIAGMRIKWLSLGACNGIKDISILKGMPLEWLNMDKCNEISDITPLKGMPLKSIRIERANLIDVAQLRVFNELENISGLFLDTKNLDSIRGMKNLKTVNNKPAEEFWKEYDAKKGATNTPKVEAGAAGARDVNPNKNMTPDELHKALKAVNPEYGMDGKFEVENGMIVGVDLCQRKISSISPLKGLPLKSINIRETDVSDLSPLKGMPLRKVNIQCCPKINDISALINMQLNEMLLSRSPVSDISVLNGMKIETLLLDDTKVTDISVVKDMPLKKISLHNLRLNDISPLRGKMFTEMDLGGSSIEDITPLQGMPLEILNIGRTNVKDIGILKGMPLKYLCIDSNNNTIDLLPLKDTNTLEKLYLPQKVLNVEALKQLPNLKFINDKPAEEFWKAKEHPAVLKLQKDLKALNPDYMMDGKFTVDEDEIVGVDLCTLKTISDISCLKGLPLRSLAIADTKGSLQNKLYIYIMA